MQIDPVWLQLEAGDTARLNARLVVMEGDSLGDYSTAWTSFDTTVATVSDDGLVTARRTGDVTISASIGGYAGTVEVAVAPDTSSQEGESPEGSAPELPRVYVDTRVPSVTGRVISVAAGGDLQAALNTAQPGDAVELAAGATYTGNFKLPAKGGSSYIVIRSSGWTSLPPEGTRVGPAQASLMAKIVSPNVMPAITNATAAGYYRLVGLEITSAPTSTSYAYSLVALSTENATSLAQYPHHIVIDRSYVHGTPTLGLQRCVTLNAAYAAVVDSYLSECHYAGNDSQAIVAWDTPGPLKIVNNYLEGAGENVMIGGAGTKVAGLVPADVEIRRNHFRKPTSWIGSQWTIKNLFETKNVRRILVEGNVFENNWAQAQQGTAIVLKSNGEGGSPQAVLEDLTFRYNIIRNSPKGVNIIGTQENYGSAAGTYTPPTNKRILLQHNLFDNVGDASMPGGNQPWIFMLYRGGEDITIDHNTVASGGTSTFVMFSGTETGTRLHFTNNIGDLGSYGIRGDGSIPTAGEGTAAFDAYAPGWTVAGNVLGLGNHKTSLYPTGNYWPTSRDALGLAGGALPAGSPYAGKATDASNPGADIPTLTAKTTGVK